VTRTWRF